MAEYKIGGIMRAGAYSPNHIGNDTAIFNIVADQLRKRGMLVNAYSEEKFLAGQVTEDIIINMCREPASVQLLQRLEDEGKLVINSGYGIENCTRERMTRILLGNGIPYPESLIVDTDERIIDKLRAMGIERCWIKRGEIHAMHKEDVSYARHLQEAQDVVQEYFMRGIKRAVINRHIDGDLIKFYGVVGTPFFHYFYPYDAQLSNENMAINGQPHMYGFDKKLFEETCRRAADVMGVIIFGGDAIVDKDGRFTIIDFNDWPSFAPCRQQAGPHIAKAIMAQIKKHYSNR